MSFKDIQGCTFFGVPEGYAAVFVSRDDFTTLVSPNDDSLLGSALSKPYSFGELFLTSVAYVEDGDVAVDIADEEIILRETTLYSRSVA